MLGQPAACLVHQDRYLATTEPTNGLEARLPELRLQTRRSCCFMRTRLSLSLPVPGLYHSLPARSPVAGLRGLDGKRLIGSDLLPLLALEGAGLEPRSRNSCILASSLFKALGPSTPTAAASFASAEAEYDQSRMTRQLKCRHLPRASCAWYLAASFRKRSATLSASAAACSKLV